MSGIIIISTFITCCMYDLSGPKMCSEKIEIIRNGKRQQ